MRSVLKLLLTVVMNLLLFVAALLLARIVIEFFGRVGAYPLAVRFMELTSPLVPSLDLGSIATPYRGVFDYDAGATLVGVLAAEWVAALLRRFVR